MYIGQIENKDHLEDTMRRQGFNKKDAIVITTIETLLCLMFICFVIGGILTTAIIS